MASLTLISDINLLNEMENGQKADILRKVQYVLAKDFDLNVSLLSLINFFMGGRTPSGDDAKLRAGLRGHGYNLAGSYNDNASFWKGILSPGEYAGLLSRPLKTEEDEAEVYAGADTGEYSSLANIGSVENEEQQHPYRKYYSRYRADHWTDEEIDDAVRDARAVAKTNRISFHKAADHVASETMNRHGDRARSKDEWIEVHGELLDTMTSAHRGEIGDEDEEQRSSRRVPTWQRKSTEDQEFSKEVTPNDYREWLRVMQLEADDREVNLNNKRHFENIAFFMLDNDPKVDMLGNNERTKRNIIKNLWGQYQVNQAKAKAHKAKFQTRLPTEDEEQTSFAQSMGMPRGKWYDRKHSEEVLSPEETAMHKDAAYQEGHGAAADHYQGVVRGMPKNPYAGGSKRHQAWSKGFSDYEKGIWDKTHGTEEDEESQQAMKSFELPHEQNALGYRDDGQPNGTPTPEAPKRQFMLVWRDGKTETIAGNDIADAFTNAGYGAGAIGALDYYKEVKDAQAAEASSL